MILLVLSWTIGVTGPADTCVFTHLLLACAIGIGGIRLTISCRAL